MEQPVKELRPMELPPLPENPLVSVLIANYNYARYLPEALDSLLAQTYTNWEAIVCDDGSTDNSRQVILDYARRDLRFRCVFKENGGVASALNAAFAESRGEIVCLLDADDVYASEKLEAAVKSFLQAPGAGFSIHRVQPISGSGKSIGRPLPADLANGWIGEQALDNGGYTRSFPPASGLSFRREVIAIVFPLPLHFRRAADGALVQIAQFFTIAVPLQGVLAYYRLHGANVTGAISISADYLVKEVNDLRLISTLQSVYLSQHFSVSAANRIRSGESPEHSLALYLLGATEPRDRQLNDLVDSVSGRRKLLWQFLLLLPRCIGAPALRFWWGRSLLKRMLLRLVPANCAESSLHN